MLVLDAVLKLDLLTSNLKFQTSLSCSADPAVLAVRLHLNAH